MRARVEPTGRGMGQRLARMSAARARVAPVASEQGRTCRWTEEPVMRRARCGATMPTNPSGPQKAVTVPVIRQADSIDRNRMRRVEAPERVAYSSPNRMISSPLPLQKARTRHPAVE